MNKIKNFIMLITIVFNAQFIKSDEDLIELNCTDDAHCKQFASTGIKSSCVQDQCRCATTSSGENTTCQPVNTNLNNIIGGPCPCELQNADCNQKQKICYCKSEFVSSRDKRRCIPKAVALDEKCEENLQCQRSDVNAVCHDSMECKCMDQFVNHDGICLSVRGKKSSSLNDTKCLEKFGANTRYSHKNKQCICERGYFASVDNSKCLEISKYLENCTENLQCIGTMGLGGICVENACKCSDNYYVEEKKNNDGVIKSVCTHVVERGQYCRYDEDCYQRQLNESEQSMHCTYGECNCKDGFNSFNDGACVRGNAAGVKLFKSLQIIFVIFSILML